MKSHDKQDGLEKANELKNQLDIAINATQKAILDAFFNFYLEAIEEISPVIAIHALQVCIKAASGEDDFRQLYEEHKAEFEMSDIRSVIDDILDLIKHPCPQNRSESYPYVQSEPGYTMFVARANEIQEIDNDGNVILKNGFFINKKDMLGRYPDIALFRQNPNSEEKIVVAKEIAGRLSLTAKGPIEKKAVVEYIRKECEQLDNKIRQCNQDYFKRLTEIIQWLSEGRVVTSDTARSDAIKALDELKKSDLEFKKAIGLRVHPLFFGQLNLPPYCNQDTLITTISRIEEHLQKNISQYDNEEKMLVQLKIDLQNKLNAIEIARKALQDKEKELDLFWEKAPLLKSEKQSQKKALIAHSRNYQSLDFPIKGFKPNEEVLIKIQEYRELRDQLSKIDAAARNIAQNMAEIHAERNRRNEVLKASNKSQYLIELARKGDFAKIKSILENHNGEPLNLNVLDRFGKSLFDYAIFHNQPFFAYWILKKYKITNPLIKKIATPNPLYKALIDQSFDALETIIKKEIEKDLAALIHHKGNRNLNELRSYYSSYGIKSQFIGNENDEAGKLSGLFEDVLSYFKSQLEFEFRRYLSGYTPGSLQFYKNAFEAINERTQFMELSEQYQRSNVTKITDGLEAKNDTGLKDSGPTKTHRTIDQRSLRQQQYVECKWDLTQHWKIHVDLSSKANILKLNFWNPHTQSFVPLDNVHRDNIHPALINAIDLFKKIRGNQPYSVILGWLYTVQEILRANKQLKEKISFHHENTKLDGHRGPVMYTLFFGLIAPTKSPLHNDRLNVVIEFVKARKHELDQLFYQKINKIMSRWGGLDTTNEKIAIFDHFKSYYQSLEKEPLSRSEIVERWVTDYASAHNNENPFHILKKQRRTGCLSIFNPSETDSIKLFKEFISDDCVSDNLRKMMLNNEPTIHQANVQNRNTLI